MRRCVLMIFFAIVCCLKISAQCSDKIDFSVLIDSQRKGEAGVIADFTLAYQIDSSQFKDKSGNISNTKILIWISKKILKYQNDVYNEISKKVLSDSEYLYYNKIDFRIDEHTDQSVNTIKDSVAYDKAWIVDYFIQNILVYRSSLNRNEYSYYLLKSKIEEDAAPDYIEKLISESVHPKDTISLLSFAISQMYLNYFVLMHEFYHSYYDKSAINNFQREVSADSFAIYKCVRLSKIVKECVSAAIYNKILIDIIKKDKEALKRNIAVHCDSSAEQHEVDYRDGDYLIYRIGNIFSNYLLGRDINLMLTNTDFVNSDIERSIQLGSISREFFRCRSDRHDFFCCLLNNELATTEDLKRKVSKINFWDYYDIKINKDSFVLLSPENPSFISFQLGNHFVKVGDFKKAAMYYESANLFEIPTYTTVLCNMLCGDIYKSIDKLRDIRKSADFYKKARTLNQIIPVLRDEIINAN